MVIIKDIVSVVGVLLVIVFWVINNGFKVGDVIWECVKKIMDEMGYWFNVNVWVLVIQCNFVIGVVIVELYDFFFVSLVYGIEILCCISNIQILMSVGFISLEIEMWVIEILMEYCCEVMVVYSKFLDDDILVYFVNQVLGFVLINCYIEVIGNCCVWLDNQVGGKLMVEYILYYGYEDIVVISSCY